MRIAIFAEVSAVQLDYLRRYLRCIQMAAENGIDANIIVEGENPATPARHTTSTPLTGVHFDAAASATGATAVQIAQQATRFGITTVEEALAHSEIPANVKRALEATL